MWRCEAREALPEKAGIIKSFHDLSPLRPFDGKLRSEWMHKL